ncbi:glycoside hydrolase family 30 protein [Anaerocolumna xylanovorans]|uniref:Glucosylceramidase n=1 Tax=Anaerocolumna xylanovorans DSM 12503 TaxID=1121345 RepID=A0A1M7YCZ8_9FIRM|nr:glycoside hydrolase family 30 beta sandwich domain-containing protein [Anaerocolumna xylanovorans]SHO50495.1 glucosylceramidase [Anaerocolumna xylanovorans DSM 12503]
MKLLLNTTTFEHNLKNESEQLFIFEPDSGIENHVVNLYPDVRYQTFEGFGGAITDSAGYVYSKMNSEQKKQVMDTYFGKKELCYGKVRIHLDSCDFSVSQYEAVSDPEDTGLQTFDLSRMKEYLIPLLEDAAKTLGKVPEILVSPWSPPAFMKTNGERSHGGKLKSEYKKLWAEYICRYITELRKLGFDVLGMTLQNEPNAVQTWDSCIYDGEEEKEFLRDYMYPALEKNELTGIDIYIWDHNKERVFERACQVIDQDTDRMITGVAFHWYSGDHFEALDLLRERFPGKKLILSEACIEYSKYGSEGYLANAQKYAHDIIGNINNGMNAFYDWNILLDETGGPNHAGNLCDAPFLYNAEKQELIERNTLSYIRHFSHYIQQGATRIAYTKYTDRLEVTAMANPDGKLVLVLLNRSEEKLPVVIRLKGKYVSFEMEKESIATGMIELE